MLNRTTPLLVDAVRETITSDERGVRIHSTMDAQPTLDFVKSAADHFKKGADQHYLGSVPILVAQVWAKECGHAIGTPGFKAYGAKKLKSGEYSLFRANLK